MKLLFLVFLALELFASNIPKTLFYGNCVACHELTSPISAPSIQELKENYKRAFPQKKEFVQYMSKWVYAPNPKTSLMHHSIQKYGLMPNLGYDEEMLRDIAGYIYDTNFKN